MQAQTYLFVPATRLERVAKAVDSGADAVIIDLEDAVIDGDRDTLRQALVKFCQSWDWSGFAQIWLRINGAQTPDFAKDVALIATLPIAGVLLPKVAHADDVVRLSSHTHKPIIAVIESATGVLNIPTIARAGVWAMSYGCLDLARSLGVVYGTPSADVVFDRVRCDMVLHSAANGLRPPIETIYPDFHDADGLARCVIRWRDMGLGGQLLIHPKQVATVKQHLCDPDKLSFAKKVLDHHQRTGQAVFAIDGQMVDLPVIEWASEYVQKLDALRWAPC